MIEQRLKVRISVTFTVTVRGIDEAGEKYEVQGVLGNISASGMYICTEKLFQVGERVFAVICLSGTSTEERTRNHCLTTVGNVVRVEDAGSQWYGAAIRFDNYKFV